LIDFRAMCPWGNDFDTSNSLSRKPKVFTKSCFISGNIQTISQKDFSSNILDPPAGRTVSPIGRQVYRLLYGFILNKHSH